MAAIDEFDAGSWVELAGFIDQIPVFATTEGKIFLKGENDRTIDAHDGLISACISLDGRELLTGGEGGKVIATTAQGGHRLIAEQKGKWIDQIAAGPQGVVAFAIGRKAFVIMADGSEKEFAEQRTIEGLAFAPKGMRLAVARYEGVSLHWITMAAKPVSLSWAGAHHRVAFSPNGQFIVTTMQENSLHGWRIDNPKKHMRMSGYPAKVKSFSWSPKGKWLVTSGAPAAVCWPFTGKLGPMGKSAKELGSAGEIPVTCVSCHPSQDVVAIGYENGIITAVRIDNGEEVPLRKEGKAAISSLNWDKQGLRLAFGSEDGEAGIVTIGG